jgi:PAS domain-containing protein
MASLSLGAARTRRACRCRREARLCQLDRRARGVQSVLGQERADQSSRRQAAAWHLKDKVVFIGAANAGAYEHHPTPFSPLQPAVELQANAVDDILSRRLLREMPALWQGLLLVLLPATLGVLVARRNARAAIFITLGAMGGVYALALFGFHNNFYWPLARPMLALAGTAACCVSFRQMRDAVSLKAAEERYALAARAANDGIWDWHLESGHVYYSPRWKAMLGHGGK